MAGEPGRRERRRIDAGERIAQSALARNAVALGERIPGAAEPGQDLLLTSACPFGDGDKKDDRHRVLAGGVAQRGLVAILGRLEGQPPRWIRGPSCQPSRSWGRRRSNAPSLPDHHI